MKIQLLAIKILNFNYKFIFNILIFLVTFYIFYCENVFNTAFCMKENISLIMESKSSIIKGTDIATPLQKEVSSFLNQAGIITEQKQIITKQQKDITNLLQDKENLLSQLNIIQKEKQTLEFERDQYEIYKKGFERMSQFSLFLLVIITITFISTNIPQKI